MRWLVFALGVLLVAAGLGCLYFSIDLGGLERGTALSISGAVYVTGGIIVLALGAILARLSDILPQALHRPDLAGDHTRESPVPFDLPEPVESSPAHGHRLGATAGSAAGAAGAAAQAAAAYAVRESEADPIREEPESTAIPPVNISSPRPDLDTPPVAPAPRDADEPAHEEAQAPLPPPLAAEPPSVRHAPASTIFSWTNRFKTGAAPASEKAAEDADAPRAAANIAEGPAGAEEPSSAPGDTSTGGETTAPDETARPRTERPRIDLAKLSEEILPKAAEPAAEPERPTPSSFLQGLRQQPPAAAPSFREEPQPLIEDEDAITLPAEKAETAPPEAAPDESEATASDARPQEPEAEAAEAESRETVDDDGDAPDPGPGLAEDEERPEPVAKEEPSLPEETASEAAAETPSATAQPAQTSASVIGRYQSGGIDYVLYADGSIEAHTGTETFRFANMAELKAFIERRPHTPIG